LNSKVFSSNNGLVKTDIDFDFGTQRDNWLWQDSIGYFFPEGGNIRVTQDFEKNNWGRINGMYNEKDTVSGYIFKTWLNHGVKPQNAHYAYIVVPGVNEKKMNNYPISNIKILSNNDFLQAVYHTRLKILQAVFYRNGSLTYDKNRISVSKPCVLMLKPARNGGVSLSVSDPTQLEKYLEIEINDKKYNCQFPAGNDAGRTIELNINNI
jgi:chondroitin AC lyase